MKLPKKIGLFAAAFSGGTALSWLELMNMFFHRPQDLNVYFFGGMFIAGLIGFGVSVIIAGDTNIRSAFLTGVAAPQILGGIIKTGTIVTSVAFIFQLSFIPQAYAKDNESIITDSTKIEINLKSAQDPVTIRDIHTKKEYRVLPGEQIIIPYSDSLEIESYGAKTQKVKIDKDYIVDSKKRLDIIVISKQRTKSLFRGLFAQQSHDSFTHKFIIKEIEQYDTPLIYGPALPDTTKGE